MLETKQFWLTAQKTTQVNGNQNCLVSNILQNIYVQQKKQDLEQHETEQMMACLGGLSKVRYLNLICSVCQALNVSWKYLCMITSFVHKGRWQGWKAEPSQWVWPVGR